MTYLTFLIIIYVNAHVLSIIVILGYWIRLGEDVHIGTYMDVTCSLVALKDVLLLLDLEGVGLGRRISRRKECTSAVYIDSWLWEYC